jgi:hypothetical protein
MSDDRGKKPTSLSSPTRGELESWRRDRAKAEILEKIAVSKDTQFLRDCQSLIEAQANHAVGRKRNYLPLKALIHMARLIGIDSLRDVELLARTDTKSPHRVSFSLDAKIAKARDERYRRFDDEFKIKQFGISVLEFESRGKSRLEALELAGQNCALTGSSRRYLENCFKAFRQLVERDGYVSNGFMLDDFPPCHTKSGLKKPGGRPSSKTAQEKPEEAQINCLVFPPFKR